MKLARAGAALLALGLLVQGEGCRRSGRSAPPAIARRVVSLSPSTTEALAAVGARDVLVGRSRQCDYPPDVALLPIVGGFTDPSLEAILALTPDLVVGARGPAGPSVARRLEAQGIGTYFPVTESLGGIDAMILGVGARTGHQADAEQVVSRLHAEEEAVSRAVAALPKERVLLVFGVGPVVVAGPGGFPDELLGRAGAVNVVDAGGAYPTLGFERVLALDPGVVVDATWSERGGASPISTSAPGWADVRAVRAGHVVVLRDDSIMRPGPRVAEGLRALARAIHPGTPLP